MNLSCCTLCPKMCKVDRENGETGFCGAGKKIRIGNYSLHLWEEPCISGTNGSGTVFFSCCPLRCIYCQNNTISNENVGLDLEPEDLTDIFLELQQKGAHNINLVTATHYLPFVIPALKAAKAKGLRIPIVYNTSGYERVETLRTLDGLIDIYLPDFKYMDDDLAIKYSKAPHYRAIAKEAIKEMYRQVGDPIFQDGLLKKGVIVRHLLLPKQIENAKKVIHYLYQTYQDHIYLSIMNQYTPIPQVNKIEELNRTVTEEEYQEVIDYAIDLGIKNAYIQEGETQKDSFIPDFDPNKLLEQLKKANK